MSNYFIDSTVLTRRSESLFQLQPDDHVIVTSRSFRRDTDHNPNEEQHYNQACTWMEENHERVEYITTVPWRDEPELILELAVKKFGRNCTIMTADPELYFAAKQQNLDVCLPLREETPPHYYPLFEGDDKDDIVDAKIHINDCLLVKNGSMSTLYRKKKYGPKQIDRLKVCNIEPRNVQQTIALDALNDPEIGIVALTGNAGGGKTLLAIASAISYVKRLKNNAQIVYVRPTVVLGGREIGFLPGGVEEKTDPYMAPLQDSLDVLGTHANNIEIITSPLQFIRGRTLRNSYVILDEAQNTFPDEVKALVTRLGEGSKLVLCGDSTQRDMRAGMTDGITHCTERLRGQSEFAWVHMIKCVRSGLAQLGVDLL